MTAPWKCATLKGTLGRFVDGKAPWWAPQFPPLSRTLNAETARPRMNCLALCTRDCGGWRNGHGHDGSPATLSLTTLLHEACLDIAEREGNWFPDRSCFIGYASRVMRGLIIDMPEAKRDQTRGEFEITSLETDPAQNPVDAKEPSSIRMHWINWLKSSLSWLSWPI